MFDHIFASMNELLDEVVRQYPSASGNKRKLLDEKISSLKAMSDTCIEQWLLFEEKLGSFIQGFGNNDEDVNDPLHMMDPELAGKKNDQFIRAQGYYKLFMYADAIEELTQILQKQPEFGLARIYLAMSYLHEGELEESCYHFQYLSRLSENHKIKAIAYNAMGCIQAGSRNMEKALEYFNFAYQTDPASITPLLEDGVCRIANGSLQFPRQLTRVAKSSESGSLLQ